MNTLISRLKPQIIQITIQELLEKMHTLRDSHLLVNLAKVLGDLEKKSFIINHQETIARLQLYINELKGYSGGIIECRIILLDIIELITGQKFDGDKWRFVEWATSKDATRFHLDLD